MPRRHVDLVRKNIPLRLAKRNQKNIGEVGITLQRVNLAAVIFSDFSASFSDTSHLLLPPPPRLCHVSSVTRCLSDFCAWRQAAFSSNQSHRKVAEGMKGGRARVGQGEGLGSQG